MNTTDLEVIFFDAAGTLIKVAEPVGVTYARFAAEYGILADPAVLEASFRSVWKKTLPPTELTMDDEQSWWRALVDQVFGVQVPQAMFDALYAHYGCHSAWQLFEDVLPALDKLSTHYRLWVLSSFDRRLRAVLAGHGLEGYFAGMTISSEVGKSKPHAAIFLHAIASANVRPEKALHVGDEPEADVQGAERAGLRAFLVRRPENDLLSLAKKLRDG
ncbi:MAG: HAD-IA family hydrolase [Verrucomicrobiaceae bacterium]|nr:HAD-IA family hydrolase [Verrucomicrobiaceae bacterium]